VRFSFPSLGYYGLEETRRCGFAIDNSEEPKGLIFAGVLVMDVRGRVVAAISLSGATLHTASRNIGKTLSTMSDEGRHKERTT
jgi:DNA-binding IclR family transcriptional regulator